MNVTVDKLSLVLAHSHAKDGLHDAAVVLSPSEVLAVLHVNPELLEPQLLSAELLRNELESSELLSAELPRTELESSELGSWLVRAECRERLQRLSQRKHHQCVCA